MPLSNVDPFLRASESDLPLERSRSLDSELELVEPLCPHELALVDVDREPLPFHRDRSLFQAFGPLFAADLGRLQRRLVGSFRRGPGKLVGLDVGRVLSVSFDLLIRRGRRRRFSSRISSFHNSTFSTGVPSLVSHLALGQLDLAVWKWLTR